MQAGRLRHRITVKEPAGNAGPTGDVKGQQYQDFATLWAKKEQSGSSEEIDDKERHEVRSTEWVIRHRDDLHADMIIDHENTRYFIESINDPDGLKRKLEISSVKEQERHSA